jgi:mannose-1-phosphate guanylyltransferase
MNDATTKQIEPDPGNWAVVLAGGQGSRLSSITMTSTGTAIPKQFCSLGAGASLLHDAVHRASAVAVASRTYVVVSEQHRQWWQKMLPSIGQCRLQVQPAARGTGIGILLPLLEIEQRDPGASVLFLPSDHYVRDEARLGASLRDAMALTRIHPDKVILLGFEPDDEDPDLGYIVPHHDGRHLSSVVSRFVEKPSRSEAHTLTVQGALWNSFIFACRPRALLQLFEARFPRAVHDLRKAMCAIGADGRSRLADVFEHLPGIDFSDEIVADNAAHLLVLRVPPCGWSDLGTPVRLAQTVRRYRHVIEGLPDAALPFQGFLNLAQATQLNSMRN